MNLFNIIEFTDKNNEGGYLIPAKHFDKRGWKEFVKSLAKAGYRTAEDWAKVNKSKQTNINKTKQKSL